MALEINDTHMILTVNDAVIATAARVDGVWYASTCPTPLSRNQAITALTVSELLATGADEDDPVVISLWEELPGA